MINSDYYVPAPIATRAANFDDGNHPDFPPSGASDDYQASHQPSQPWATGGYASPQKVPRGYDRRSLVDGFGGDGMTMPGSDAASFDSTQVEQGSYQ